MIVKQYFLVLILAATYCVNPTTSDIVKNNHARRIRNELSKDQKDTPKMAQSRKKREDPYPIKRSGDQLSVFVNVVNSIILGEAVVRRLTTFGEIGLNLMLMGNMPAGGDWINSVNPKGIDMTSMGKLPEFIENGFHKTISTEVIDEVMRIKEEIAPFDPLSKLLAEIKVVSAAYVDFDFGDTTAALELLGLLPTAIPILSNISKDSKPLDSLKIGAEIISKYFILDARRMEKNYKSCNDSMSSEKCVNAFHKLRDIPFDKISIPDIETVTVLLDLLRHSDQAHSSLVQLVKQKTIITSLHSLFAEIDKLQKKPVDVSSIQKKFSKLFSSLDKLTADRLKIEEMAEALEIFVPVSDTIAKMQETYENSSRNENGTSIFNSFIGLPGGITTLTNLSEILRNSGSPPDEYRESKIVERMTMMMNFVTQRAEFLNTSEGVKPVQRMSSIIKALKSCLSQVSNSLLLGKTFNSTLKDYENLKSIGLESGIDVLGDIEKRMANLDETQLTTFLTTIAKLNISVNTNALYRLFPRLTRVVKSAIEVDNLMKTNGAANKTIFSEAIAASKAFTDAAGLYKDVFSVPDKQQIEAFKNMINVLNLDSIQLNNGNLAIEDTISGWTLTDSVHSEIGKIVKRKNEHSKFESSLTELKKIETELSVVPSQKEIKDLKSLLKEFSQLRQLEIPQVSELKPSPRIGIFMGGPTYGADILTKLSKGANKYLDLIKDVPNIGLLLADNTVERSVKAITIDAFEIRIVGGDISAYAVFNEWETIWPKFERYTRFIDRAIREIQDYNLKPNIEKNANSSLVFNFLSRIDDSALLSSVAFKNDIWKVLMALAYEADCIKTPVNKMCTNRKKGGEESEDETIDIDYFDRNNTRNWVIAIVTGLLMGLFIPENIYEYCIFKGRKNMKIRCKQRRARKALKKDSKSVVTPQSPGTPQTSGTPLPSGTQPAPGPPEPSGTTQPVGPPKPPATKQTPGIQPKQAKKGSKEVGSKEKQVAVPGVKLNNNTKNAVAPVAKK